MDVVRQLVEAGVDLTIQNKGDETAYDKAVKDDHAEIASYIQDQVRELIVKLLSG